MDHIISIRVALLISAAAMAGLTACGGRTLVTGRPTAVASALSGTARPGGQTGNTACTILATQDLQAILGTRGPLNTNIYGNPRICAVQTPKRAVVINLECGADGTQQYNDFLPASRTVAGTHHVRFAATFGYFVRLHNVPGKGACTLSALAAADRTTGNDVPGSKGPLAAALDRAFERAQ